MFTYRSDTQLLRRASTDPLLFNNPNHSRIDPRKRAALEASLETANNANHKFRSPCQLWN